METPSFDAESPRTTSDAEYRIALKSFDSAVCEAIAVSQGLANRFLPPCLGYAINLFARMCSFARSQLSATPLNRWTNTDHEFWDISAVAPHARALIEGYLLFRYLVDAPRDEDTARAIVQVMHLYDITRRSEIFGGNESPELIAFSESQRIEIVNRIQSTRLYQNLSDKKKKVILEGRSLTIETREDILNKIGWEKKSFDSIWHFLSQHTHVFTLSFYRMEVNGRGTGLKNDADKSMIYSTLPVSEAILRDATDILCNEFPEVSERRKGLDSRFSPGPKRNLPKDFKRGTRSKAIRH